MYFDTKILSILYKTEGRPIEFDKVKQEYDSAVFEIIFNILEIYLTDERLEKPKIKGFVDLIEASDKDLSNLETVKLYRNALGAASAQKPFQVLLKTALDKFHNSMLEDMVPDLSPEDATKLQDYLTELETNIKDNKFAYAELLKQYQGDNSETNEVTENSAIPTPELPTASVQPKASLGNTEQSVNNSPINPSENQPDKGTVTFQR